jgi:hypothetical protein
MSHPSITSQVTAIFSDLVRLRRLAKDKGELDAFEAHVRRLATHEQYGIPGLQPTAPQPSTPKVLASERPRSLGMLGSVLVEAETGLHECSHAIVADLLGAYGRSYRRARADLIGLPCALRLPGCTGVATAADHVVPVARGGASGPLRPA